MSGISDVNTLVWVALSILVFAVGVHPHLSGPMRIYFYFLLAWTPAYIVGQFAQDGKWGSLWMQYQLLDLCYMQWGAVLLTGLWVCWRKFSRKAYNGITITRWMPAALICTLGFGFVSEFWDTFWTWRDGSPLLLSFDTGDYVCLAVSAAILIVPFYAMKVTIPHRMVLQAS